MRLHRFYIDKKIETDLIKINEERLVHQWRDVFRYNVGTEVILFDGSGFEYDSVIEKLNNREANLKIVSKRKGIVLKNKIIFFQSLIKKDNMEWIVEKVTELGVSKIIPIISERSEKKGFNLERAKKIAIEASEQCGRSDVPEIGEVKSLEEVLNGSENIIVFDSSGNNSPFSLSRDPSLNTREGNAPLTSVFIGPEGGWSPKELNLFKDKNAKVYSLGALTLRAETAAIAALTILGLQN